VAPAGGTAIASPPAPHLCRSPRRGRTRRKPRGAAAPSRSTAPRSRPEPPGHGDGRLGRCHGPPATLGATTGSWAEAHPMRLAGKGSPVPRKLSPPARGQPRGAAPPTRGAHSHEPRLHRAPGPAPTHRARLDLEVPLDAAGQEEELALGAASSLRGGHALGRAGGPSHSKTPRDAPNPQTTPLGPSRGDHPASCLSHQGEPPCPPPHGAASP